MKFFRIYRLYFKTAKDFSIYNSLKHYFSIPLRLYIARRTKLTRFNRSKMHIDGRLFIDCKNGGQFYYYSSLVLMENSRLCISGDVNFFSGLNLKLFKNSELQIGDGTYFSGPVTLHCKKDIKIGANCAIAWGVTIIDSNFHKLPGKQSIKTEPVIIEDNVWIGCNSVILPGTIIKNGAVIPAGSVVRGIVSSNKVYGRQ